MEKANQPVETPPAVPAWQTAFKLRDRLVQRDVGAYEAVFTRLGGWTGAGSALAAERALKAAIEAGWLVEPVSEVLTDQAGKKRYTLGGENVDDAHPGKVRWYGASVLARYTETQQPPPN